METLTLANGRKLDGSILPNGDGLTIFVYLYGLSILEGATIFSNKGNIATITAMNHGTETVYEGYTEMTSINNEYGNCNIVLRRPYNVT